MALSCSLSLAKKPISKILTNLPSTHLDGFGSDQTRVAVCRVVTCIASTPWPSSISSIPTFLPTVWNIVNTSLERREEVVQEGASLAVRALSGWCGVEERIVRGWVEGVKVGNWNRFERRGCALALGKLRVEVLRRFVWDVLGGLCAACVVQVRSVRICLDLSAWLCRRCVFSLLCRRIN